MLSSPSMLFLLFSVFGWSPYGLFQLISAYFLSQNTIESSETIRNPLCSLPAKHAEDLIARMVLIPWIEVRGKEDVVWYKISPNNLSSS